MTEPVRARGLRTPEGSLLGGSVAPTRQCQSVACLATGVEIEGYSRLSPPMVWGAEAEEHSRLFPPKERGV